VNGTYAGLTSGPVPTPPAVWDPDQDVGEGDAFIVKVDPTGNVVYFTYVGGNYTESGTGITVDAAGIVSIAMESFLPLAYLEALAVYNETIARCCGGGGIDGIDVATAEPMPWLQVAAPETGLRPAAPEVFTFVAQDSPAPPALPNPPSLTATGNALQANFGGGFSDAMIVRASGANGAVTRRAGAR